VMQTQVLSVESLRTKATRGYPLGIVL